MIELLSRRRPAPALFLVPVLLAACADGTGLPDGGPLRFAGVSAGEDHVCGLSTENATWCWGANQSGQTGANAGVGVPEPELLLIRPVAFTAVSAGETMSCGLSADGEVACWGGGRREPRKLEAAPPLSTIAVGSEGCGLDAAGKAWCWTPATLSAEPLSGGLSFEVLSMGGMGCGLTAAGDAWCWPDHLATPQQVGGGVVFTTVSVGAAHACGLTSTGASWCWGANESGQLGTLSTAPSTNPTQVQLAQPFVAISAGGHHSCGVTAAGDAYCWGAASAGQLGWGGLPPDYGVRFSAPVHVTAPGVVFRAISAGGSHTCALAEDARVYCWGENAGGQVGNGVFDEQPLPTTVNLQ